MQRTLSELATHMSALSDAVTIGTISVGCALWYLDRRYEEVRWRDREPDLAAWFDVWHARPAAVATAPPPGHPGASEALRNRGAAPRS